MIRFNCYGHENMLGKHKNTLEFTKDKDVTLKGDCIIGVRSDFDKDEIIDFISGKNKLICKITVDDISDEFEFEPNKDFCSDEELVFRKSDFSSKRTLGVHASKSAKMINREIIEKMKDPDVVMTVKIYPQ